MTDNSDSGESGALEIFDILDLSSPLLNTYRAVLKNSDVSHDELFLLFPDQPAEELRIYLNLLCRLGHLEKYADSNNKIRFKVKGRARRKTSLPKDIWEQLGS